MAIDNYALGQRDGALASARAWEEYAHKLEQAILNLRRVDKGHRDLERALIAELKPGSRLADKNLRQGIFNAGFQSASVTVQGD